jgi:hypothetical protein
MIEGLNISLRDYIAVQAMPIAIRLHDDISDGQILYLGEDGYEMGEEAGSVGTWYPHTKFFAEACYAIADEFMKQREVKHEEAPYK